jgi:hypothetical protein
MGKRIGLKTAILFWCFVTKNRMYLLIAIGFFLQNVNAGLSGVVHNAMASLMVASLVGAYQLYIHLQGIQFDPTKEGQKQ